jgi:Divergent InlB B-repeat domain
MGILRTIALAALAACYSPDIPDCARTDSCGLSAGDAAGADAPVDARPADAAAPDAPPNTVALTVRIDGRGDVTVPGVGTCSAGNGAATCPFVVTKGVPLTINATPKNGWRFDRWEDACMGTSGATCTLTPMTATSVRARFEEIDD